MSENIENIALETPDDAALLLAKIESMRQSLTMNCFLIWLSLILTL